jgi:hypothetical protein
MFCCLVSDLHQVIYQQAAVPAIAIVFGLLQIGEFKETSNVAMTPQFLVFMWF